MPEPLSTGQNNLVIRWNGRNWKFSPSATVRVGRDASAEVRVDDDRVSRRHLRIAHSGGLWWVADEASHNGTWVVGPDRVLDKPMPLLPEGLRLRLGHVDGPELLLETVPPEAATEPRVLTIGRSRSCTITLDDPLVSHHHALIETGELAVVRDTGSFNGTFLNGHRILSTAPLSAGDLIGVGTTSLTWDGSGIVTPQPQRPVFSARHLEVTTKSGVHLIDDLSFTVPAGTLVAVIGPSGAGKSTLLGALTGLRPATRGRVTWNGRDLYSEYAQLRFLVGLVPQEDILHRQLTVRRALQFAARLRLPPDTSKGERDDRINQVVSEVDLAKHIDERVNVLSDGQRKRTSIALELLTAPQLIFLDEPTSGLDPALDVQVMRSLRALAEAGRVIFVVTHSVLALNECDRVLVLAHGGRVAFFGPLSGLLPFFNVKDYLAVFAALEDQTWVGRYSRSPAREAYGGGTALAVVPVPAADSPPPPREKPLRQLGTLIRRNAAVVAADRLLIGLLVGMPALLALLAHTFPGGAGLSLQAAQGEYLQIQHRLIVLVVGAALMGATLSIRELVGERPVYRREHAVGLSPWAYLLSKVVVLGLLVAVQCSLFTLLALLGQPGPDHALVLGNGVLEVTVAVAAVGFTMTVAGLAVSATATSTDQAMPALAALVMPQLVLCGGLFTIAGRAGIEQVSWFLPARFGYAATAATVGLQRPPSPKIDQLFDPTAQQLLLDLGLLGIQLLLFVMLTALALHRSTQRNVRRGRT